LNLLFCDKRIKKTIIDKNQDQNTISNNISLFGNKLIEKYLEDVKIIILEEDKEIYNQALNMFLDWVNFLEEMLFENAGSGYYETVLPFEIRKHFFIEKDIDCSQTDIYDKLYFLDKIRQDYFSGNIKMSAYLYDDIIEVKFYWH